jgi:hypothetical protein
MSTPDRSLPRQAREGLVRISGSVHPATKRKIHLAAMKLRRSDSSVIAIAIEEFVNRVLGAAPTPEADQ